MKYLQNLQIVSVVQSKFGEHTPVAVAKIKIKVHWFRARQAFPTRNSWIAMKINDRDSPGSAWEENEAVDINPPRPLRFVTPRAARSCEIQGIEWPRRYSDDSSWFLWFSRDENDCETVLRASAVVASEFSSTRCECWPPTWNYVRPSNEIKSVTSCQERAADSWTTARA